MEIGRLAARQDAARDEDGEQPRQSAATEVGMGAHAAQLCIALLLHAFAGHGGEAAVDADAEEIAERLRPQGERAGLRQLGQRQHFRGVGFGQPLDAGVGHRIERARQRHLHRWPGPYDGEARRRRHGGGLRQRHEFARPRQGGERRQTVATVVARGGEWNDRRIVTPRQRPAFRQRGVTGGEGVPDRAVEDVGHGSLTTWSGCGGGRSRRATARHPAFREAA